MIKLSNLLREQGFDIGKVPFTDTNSAAIRDYQKLQTIIDKFKLKKEPNTEDEEEFLKSLQLYFDDPVHNIDHNFMLKGFNVLLPLKHQFPGILNPATQAPFAYRGTTIDVKTLLKYQYGPLDKSVLGYPVNRKITIHPKGTQGFFSFSLDIDVAYDFGGDWNNEWDPIDNGLVPCIIRISTSTPNLLFTSKFTDTISDTSMVEDETIHVGKPIHHATIYVRENELKSMIYELEGQPNAPFRKEYFQLAQRLRIS